MSTSVSPFKKEKVLPLLSVKQDTSLKSCLSTTSLTRRDSHPIAYNNHHHDLREHDDQDALISPKLRSSPSSILSSNPALSPVLHHANHGLPPVPKMPPVLVSLPPSTSPPLSRISSLRYANASDNKKIIESTRQRTSSPTISSLASSPQLLPASGDDGASAEPCTKKHLMIAITGCISIHQNIFLMIEKLFELYTTEKLDIQVILTEAAACLFTDKLYKFDELGVKVWFHDDGMKHYLTRKLVNPLQFPPNPASNMRLTASILSQYVLAYDLQKWTDVLLIAPLLANTMAKLINGLSDNLLTEMLHLWPIPLNLLSATPDAAQNQSTTVLTNNLSAPKPIISALALTNAMYSHPITRRQLLELKETYPNMSILKPVEKCVDVDGNIAMGGMRSWREVVNFVVQKLGEPEQDEDDEEEDEEDDEEEKEVEIVVKHSPVARETTSITRHRSDTVSNKELAEHQKIATINAMLNTGMGTTSRC